MAKVIRVMADGTGDYDRLSDALRKAPAGSEVHLGAGEYDLGRGMHIHRPTTLIGAGMSKTIVRASKGRRVLKFSCRGTVHLRDITFEAHMRGKRGADVVVIDAAQVQVEQCRFAGGLSGLKSDHGDGLQIIGKTKGMVRDSQFKRNGRDGTRLGRKAAVELFDNIAIGNVQAGIYYQGQAVGKAQGNVCSENYNHGIAVTGHAAPLLMHNTCLKNGQAGIAYSQQAGGIAQSNTCSENKAYGIYLIEFAAPELVENICSQNQQGGIIYYNETRGTARANICTKNGLFGIFLITQASPEVIQNVCDENQEEGIVCLGHTQSVVKGNMCRANKIGLLVKEGTLPMLVGNLCEGNTEADVSEGDGEAK